MATYSASVDRSLPPVLLLPQPFVHVSPLSCCQQAVMEALESAPSMGLIVSLALWTGGFSIGFGMAWFIFA